MRALSRIVCVMAVAGAAAAPSFAAAQTDPAQPVVLPSETIIRVKGEGMVQYRPEVVTLDIGVATSGLSAEQALVENNEKSSELVAAIRKAGFAANDIKTTRLNVEPDYDEDDDDNRIIGWRAVNNLTLRTQRLGEVGAVITALFAAGGNTLDGPTFSLTEETTLRATREAEAKALIEAREQADATAAALGMRVARVLLVSDSGVRFDGGGGYIVVTGSRIKQPAVPIEPGDIEVSASYSVEFALVAM
ncbi:SIMPL domain-containing protein [Qipengyuania marisflavi]|nr:SIMPL domain-containing protein [Qipengyuania marisflavi]